jgi:CRP/FNR family cyclic AMP-dependent transcriptional regulator
MNKLATATSALRQSALLRDLPEAAVRELIEIGSEKTWRQGSVIFSRGDAPESLQLVIEGRVSVREATPDGRSLTLAMFGPCEIFGEVGVIDGELRSADAFADIDTRLFIVERRQFLAYLESHPAMAIRMMQTLCARLRKTNALVSGMAFNSARARVAQRLLTLTKGTSDVQPGSRELKMTGQELADYCALTRESVSKQLARWREQGIVALARGRIAVINMAALEAAAVDRDAR